MSDGAIGMQSGLQENAGAAESDGLFDFLQDGVEREDVAFLGSHGPIEGAEGAIFGTEIGVVDIAIDLIAGDSRVVLLFAQLIRGHTDAYQVIGLEEIESFLLRHAHSSAGSLRMSCTLGCWRHVLSSWPHGP